jgi:hypothetical protein
MDYPHETVVETATLPSGRQITALFKPSLTVDDLVFLQSRAYASARAAQQPLDTGSPRRVEAQITRVPYAR